MLFLPHPRSVQMSCNASGRPSTTYGTQITADASSHTLGTKTEIFSATAHEAFWVDIIVHDSRTAGTRTDQLLNIYIGASGAEQVLIPNLLAGWAPNMNAASGLRRYGFPLYIPKGSRITAALQALISADTLYVVMSLYGGGQPPCWVGRGVECLGATVASSIGTSVTPGGASDGTFTDIGTSTRRYGFVLPMMQGGMADTNLVNATIALDIGVGSALLTDHENYLFTADGGEETYTNGGGRFCNIPSGTALQLRGQTSNATAEAMDCTIYGVY